MNIEHKNISQVDDQCSPQVQREFWNLVDQDRIPVLRIIFKLSEHYTISIDEVFESIH